MDDGDKGGTESSVRQSHAANNLVYLKFHPKEMKFIILLVELELRLHLIIQGTWPQQLNNL